MFTDPKRIRLLDPGHPEECNVFSYYKVFVPNREKEVYHWCKNAKVGCTDCKCILADNLVKRLKIHQEKRMSWIKNKAGMKRILMQGQKKASKVASQTINQVKEIIDISSL